MPCEHLKQLYRLCAILRSRAVYLKLRFPGGLPGLDFLHPGYRKATKRLEEGGFYG